MLDLSNIPEAFGEVLRGAADTPQIAAFLQALNQRGIQTADLVALVQAMRAHALPFPAMPDAIDVCGTGGDGLNTPNISTAVAFVVAGCGVPVVKHGNRAASSSSGSADVLEALGVNIMAHAETSARALREAGLCFLFARSYHPAMLHVAEARKQLGTRTIFNLAGPLANPARPGYQLVGVYDKVWLQPMAEALQALGSKAIWVVHSRDGMDELSTMAPNDIVSLREGALHSFTLDPAAYGLERPEPGALRGGDASTNALIIRAMLDGQTGPLQDIVCLNAAAALCVTGKVHDISAGLIRARAAISSGAAANCLKQLVSITKAA